MARRTAVSLGALFVVTALTAGCGDSTSPEQPGPPTDIKVSAGSGQTGAAASVLIGPLAAKVTDAKGRGVPNVDVSFQPLANSGTVNPISSRTNAAGIATTSWTLPTLAGTGATVRAVFVDPQTGAFIDSASFNVTVVGGAPVYMYQSASYFLAATGSRVGPLTVTLIDQYSNLSPNASVTWTRVGGDGTLSAATTLSNAEGVASVYYTLGSAAGTSTVQARIGDLWANFYIEGQVAGQPQTLDAIPYPEVAPVGGTLSLQVVVRDGLGEPVSGKTVAWTVGFGTGTLAAPTSVTNANGVASVQFTLGQFTGDNVVNATLGNLGASFSIRGRILTQRLTYTNGSAFGIARTGSGKFVVSMIDRGTVQTFQQNSPDTKQTITTGGTPVVVAVDDAGQYAYVSNTGGWMDVIDLALNAVVKQVSVPNAHALALSPAGDRVYVTSTAGYVYAVSTTSRQLVDSVYVAYGPWGIAFRTNTVDSLMYVTSRDGGSVTEVDMKTFSVLRKFNIGGRPHGIVISGDQQTLYVADNWDGQVKKVDIASGTVTGFADLGGAFGIAISPSATTLYVTTDYGQAAVLDLPSLTITKALDTDGRARQLVVAPDGNTAWAANDNGWVDIIPR